MSSADKTCKKQKQYIIPVLCYTIPNYITLHYHYTVLYTPYYTIESPLLIIDMGQSPWPRGLRRGSAAAEIVGSNPAGGMDVCLF
jgi:hypothetical protein